MERTEESVLALLRGRGMTLAAAESCTGGLFSKRMTDLAGASAVFCGGVVSYVNAVKERVLGVRGETLARFGAVSEETAREMAQGVRRICGSDLGISFTGVAGPSQDERGNAVGTVYVAVATKDRCTVERLMLTGDRAEIRDAAVERGFAMVESVLLPLPR